MWSADHSLRNANVAQPGWPFHYMLISTCFGLINYYCIPIGMNCLSLTCCDYFKYVSYLEPNRNLMALREELISVAAPGFVCNGYWNKFELIG